MTSTVKNIKVGNTSYPVQDTKATPFLSSTDEATLLSNGTYRGETVANNTIFATAGGVLKRFTKTIVDKHWITGTAQTRLGRTNISLFEHASAQNGNTIVTAPYYGDARKSLDRGVTWSSFGTGTSNPDTDSIVYWPKTGKFYAGTRYGLLTTDGSSWTKLSKYTSMRPRCADENVLVCPTGYFTDESTYTAYSESWYRVEYDAATGKFYAQLATNGDFYESSNGIDWTLKGKPGQYFNFIAAYNGTIVGFRRNGTSNTKRYVSTDEGVTWTSEAFADQAWFGGVYQGLFYMGRTDSVDTFMISTDGLTWTQMNRPDSFPPQALVMVDDKVYMGNYAYYFTTGIDYEYALTPQSYTASEVDSAIANAISEVPSWLTGNADPTTALHGLMGQRYLNTTDGTTFVCTQAYEAPLSTTNYTINGDPTISSGYVLSNCSASNYITGSQKFNCATSTSSTWAIETEITLPSSLSGRQHYMAIGTGDHVLIQDGSYLYWSMSNWNVPFESSSLRHLVTAGKTYTMRMEYDGTNLNWYISDNGTIPSTPTHTYAHTGSLTSGNSIFFGCRPAYSSQYAQGSINLLKTKIYASGTLYWEAVTQTGGQDAEWTGLQNKLTAGTGITIDENNVISSTGGGGGASYTAGAGIDITNGVISNTGLVNTATGTDSLTILGSSATDYDATNIGKQSYSGIGGVAVGRTASAGTSSVAVGYESFAYGGNYATAIGGGARATAERAIAVGCGATASASHAIQIGRGSNSTANTMNVGLSSSLNVQLLDSSGNIPEARLSNIYEVVQTMPASPTSGKIYFVTGA